MSGLGGQMIKRIPRIQFPQRHLQSFSQGGEDSIPRSDVPAAPKNMGVGGKASLQPKRTPVSDKEIESIMLGGAAEFQ